MKSSEKRHFRSVMTRNDNKTVNVTLNEKKRQHKYIYGEIRKRTYIYDISDDWTKVYMYIVTNKLET